MLGFDGTECVTDGLVVDIREHVCDNIPVSQTSKQEEPNA